jgi:hypothetical protein
VPAPDFKSGGDRGDAVPASSILVRFRHSSRRRNGIAMGSLERDTQLQGADGRHRAELSEGWRIRGPNGGHVAGGGQLRCRTRPPAP